MIPLTESVASLTERPGYLRLKGKESLSSPYQQSLVARRQQAFCYTAETCVEFNPESHKHLAGLVCYYSTMNYHYLYISKNKNRKCLGIRSFIILTSNSFGIVLAYAPGPARQMFFTPHSSSMPFSSSGIKE